MHIYVNPLYFEYHFLDLLLMYLQPHPNQWLCKYANLWFLSFYAQQHKCCGIHFIQTLPTVTKMSDQIL